MKAERIMIFVVIFLIAGMTGTFWYFHKKQGNVDGLGLLSSRKYCIIRVGNVKYYIKKIDDNTVNIGIDRKGKYGSRDYNIEELQKEPYYQDIKNWLKGGLLPENKQYSRV